MSELKDAVYVIGSAVAVKTIVQWSSDQLGRFLHWFFVHTERDAIIWTHHYKHALGDRHKPKSVFPCEDDACQLI